MIAIKKIIRSKFYICLVPAVILLLFTSPLTSQDLSQSDKKSESTISLMGLGEGAYSKMPDVQGGNMFMASVDEEEYLVDAGDVFIIKVDVKGPAVKIFNSMVTPDGFLVIPDAPTVYIRDLTLKEAKAKIDLVLQKNFPQATVESYLFQVHSIRVSVLGALPRSGKIMLSSSDRLYDAVSGMLDPFVLDTLTMFNWDVISFRSVQVQRNDQAVSYDLLKYKLLGDRSQNPYLQDEDIVYINFKDSTQYMISVRGAVARPVEFEYMRGDRLGTALQFASGLLPIADSTRVELVRFSDNQKELNRILLSFPADSSFQLQADDRIYIRGKTGYHKKYSVFVEGEVAYPGEYAIENGKTFLSDLIAQAGGFAPDAAVLSSSVLRMAQGSIEEVELKRLENIRPAEMTVEEASYFRLRTRENRYLVTIDYHKLFNDKDSSADVLLHDMDLIKIPGRKMTVFVSGGVLRPGNVTYRPDWKVEDYIEAAGGFSDMARQGWISLIDSRTGKWNEIMDEDNVKEGDIIFIPESNRIDWYYRFLEGLAVVAQISAIVLVVVTLAK